MAGVQAHYAYEGGNNLEVRLRDFPFAHAILERHATLSAPRSLAALRRLIRRVQPELLHAHLTHDHILALLGAPRKIPVIRTFHAARALRRDPGTHLLLARTRAVAVVNHALRKHPLIARRNLVEVTPPPLDTRIFTPGGMSARDQLGIAKDTPLVGYIGKVAPARGFEEAIDTFAEIRKAVPAAKLMIIGRGPHRPILEQRVATLSLTEAVIWAGYVDAGLADHYRAADVMLFTAPGSDHGHRAVLEELGCGTPVACYPIPGMAELLGPWAERLIASAPTPVALASTAVALLNDRSPQLARSLSVHASSFDYSVAAQRLIRLYSQCLDSAT